MVSIKEAVEKATVFAQAALGDERTRSVRLEELESTTTVGKDAWLITLSMKNPDVDPFTTLVKPERERDYKVFTVLKDDGQVISMRIREMAEA